MKWRIPAKTFLLGEYAAIAEASAIILTTTPYFELSLTPQEELIGIHPESPAGRWWKQAQCGNKGLSWHDPYRGQGGLGASSAQFLASYLASCSLKNKTPCVTDMLEAYYSSSWSGTGLRPSGYDVIAQSQQGCVYINKQKKIIQSYPWNFADLSFVLVHTGMKLATHHHLQVTTLPSQTNHLSAIVDEAQHALTQNNSEQLINTINCYHQKLNELNLVAPHSLELINALKKHSEVLAIKGCGALGADVILILTSRYDMLSLKEKLVAQNRIILATEADLTNTLIRPLIKIEKSLELNQPDYLKK
jgi:mevalonate kinase